MPHAVTLVAPVAPFRGGIARHSEAVARALVRSGSEIEVESFARLYPRWLYPGESDRDPGARATLPCPARFALDTLNPLTWRAAAARIVARGGIAVIPAWTFFVAPALGAIARRLRRDGVKVVMLVHNVADHDAEGWKSRLSNWQLAAADAFVTHTPQLEAQLRRAGHRQPVAVVPHPSYDDMPGADGTLPRERALELLCFGLVRPYKGVDIALRALAESGLADVRLTIAGEIWEGRDTIERLAQDPRLAGKVELVDRYVSDAEAAELFARCDAVLAPYRSVTGSGVLALARHYRRPVVASNLPGLADSVVHASTGWLFPAGDESALARLLAGPVTRNAAHAMQPALESAARGGGWDAYAGAIRVIAGA